jgi:cardiolipin synthase
VTRLKIPRRIHWRILQQLPERETEITTATWITFVRILLTPWIVGAMVAGQWGAAFVLFCTSALTDVVDGAIARVFNQKTFLGACIDPVADKVLLLSCFATLAFIDTPLFAIPLWFVLLVLAKEVFQLSGAFFIFYKKGHFEVQPTMLGKLTTFVQVMFIIWLFSCYFLQWMPIKTYYAMLGIMLFLVFCTFVQYAYNGWRVWQS